MSGGNRWAALIFVLSVLVLCDQIAADEGPRAFREERVIAHYLQNGYVNTTATKLDCPLSIDHISAYSNDNYCPCCYGKIYVTVPNNDDVLQFVRVNLSANTNTNLVDPDDSVSGFADTLSSYPYSSNSNLALAKKELLINTTENGTSTFYNFTSANAVTGPIKIVMNYSTSSNYNGGNDTTSPQDNLTTGYSTLNITFMLTNLGGTHNLNGVTTIVQLNKDINGGGGDFANITTTPEGCTVSDTDTDNYNDQLSCTYNLNAGSSNTTSFNATVHNTNNWNSATLAKMDSDSKGYKANWHSTSSTHLTGLTISYNFTRASVREGVDLAPAGSVWRIRGKFRNIANNTPNAGDENLTYFLKSYSFYEVKGTTLSGPHSNTNVNIYLDPGSECSTTSCSWFETTNTTKNTVYYAPSFEWYVLWDNTSATSARNYYSVINTTLNLPYLRYIDIATTGASSGALAPDQANQPIEINVTSKHVGNPDIKVGKVSIHMIIPRVTTAGTLRGKSFDIQNSSIMAYWCGIDGTCVRINMSDSTVSNSSLEPSTTADGKIILEINDLNSTQLMNGSNMQNLSYNEYIKLSFIVLSDLAMTTGDTYFFNGTHNQTTISGTPIQEDIASTTISVSSKMLTSYKELFIENPANTSLVNVTILLSAATGGPTDAITGIRWTDYVPWGTTFNRSGTWGPTLRFNSGGWSTWVINTDYNVSFRGNVTMPDGMVMAAWEYTNETTGPFNTANFTLVDGQQIEVKYQLYITSSGLYRLPVIIAGFDPDTGETISTSNYGVIRVVMPESMSSLVIEEDKLIGAVNVGKPVMWNKNIEAFNPNTRPATARFSVKVFDDANGVYISYYNQKGEKVEETVSVFSESGGRFATWETSIGALETRTYEIRTVTPPVLEVDRNVQVLEKLEDKKVSLKMESYLKNFAAEAYQNVRLNLPIAYDKVTSVIDAFGASLSYTGGASSTTIILDAIGGGEIKTIAMEYKESYPIIIITPSRDRYDLNSPVDLNILVINGGEKLQYPYLELEVYTPEMELVYSAVKDMAKLDPLEKTEMTEKFKIPSVAPAGTYIVEARFSENFAVIAQGTGNFYVTGTAGIDLGMFEVVIVVVLAGVLMYFSTRRLIDVRKRAATVTPASAE
jgi:hypothetical protein